MTFSNHPTSKSKFLSIQGKNGRFKTNPPGEKIRFQVWHFWVPWNPEGSRYDVLRFRLNFPYNPITILGMGWIQTIQSIPRNREVGQGFLGNITPRSCQRQWLRWQPGPAFLGGRYSPLGEDLWKKWCAQKNMERKEFWGNPLNKISNWTCRLVTSPPKNWCLNMFEFYMLE